ncbi:hypothetical protein BDW59DRAFT_165397 [Aspergillus cavernicola]|uniref:F-box domain-containing protein n=1 Tax=Aspergillus cavernicola TaxID=176166 RepID=A0ABR4HTB4_9EURO
MFDGWVSTWLLVNQQPRPNIRRKAITEEDAADQYRQALADENEWTFPIMSYKELFARGGTKLVGLEDFIWFTCTKFPPSFLDILHRDLPQCRLHLKAFSFGGLLDSKDAHIREYASKLATSPCLSSIVCWMTLDVDSRIEQAVGEMAGGAAPNLIKLYILYNMPHHSKELLPPNIFPNNTQRLSSVRLLSQHNSSLKGATSDELEVWSKHVPFHMLHVLQLHGFGDARVLENAPRYHFSSLKALALDFDITRVHIEDPEGTAHQMDCAASVFVSSLPPLESLFLSSTYADKTLKAAIRQHGPTLQRLSLGPRYSQDPWRWVLTSESLQETGRTCPKLSTLQVRVQRTQGNLDEVSIYKALAGFPHPKHPTIELDCALRAHDNPYGSKTDRDFLINIAADEALGRSILDIILNGSPWSPLQSFKVIPRVAGRLHISFRDLVGVMHKTWELWRPVYSEDFIVTRASQMEYVDWVDIPEDLESEFRDLWPAKSDDWTKDWHSLPLAVDCGM